MPTQEQTQSEFFPGKGEPVKDNLLTRGVVMVKKENVVSVATRDLADKFNVNEVLFLGIQYLVKGNQFPLGKGDTLGDDLYEYLAALRDSLHNNPEVLKIPIALFDQALTTYQAREIPKHFFDTVYTNYRGETVRRSVFPITISFKSTEYHPEEQYILTGIDLDRMVIRDFAVRDFKSIMFQPIKEDEFRT